MAIGEKLRSWARRIKRDGVTLWFAAKHPMTPWYAKALGAFVVAYALSPIDLIPDFIPVLGYVDDLILLPVLIWLALQLCPKPVIQSSQQKADDWWSEQQQRPVSLVGLAGIVVIWLMLAATFGVWVYRRLGE